MTTKRTKRAPVPACEQCKKTGVQLHVAFNRSLCAPCFSVALEDATKAAAQRAIEDFMESDEYAGS
jgi:hypothetical protein